MSGTAIRMALSILVLTGLLIGCAAFEPERTADLDPQEVERVERLKNLAAITELQIALPAPPALPKSNAPISAAEKSPENAASPPAERQDQPAVAPSWFSQYVPTESSSLQSQRLLPSTRMDRSPYGRSNPYPLNPSLVPPYTVFVPTGSFYPGSVRCVPDYLGGSRCSVRP